MNSRPGSSSTCVHPLRGAQPLKHPLMPQPLQALLSAHRLNCNTFPSPLLSLGLQAEFTGLRIRIPTFPLLIHPGKESEPCKNHRDPPHPLTCQRKTSRISPHS